MPTINADCRYSPMLHGVATTLFAQIITASTSPDIDLLTGAAKYQRGDLHLIVDRAEDVGVNISVQTHKLFDVLVLALGSQNTYRCPTSKIKTQVSISLDEYLALCGKPRTKFRWMSIWHSVGSLEPKHQRTNCGKRCQKS